MRALAVFFYLCFAVAGHAESAKVSANAQGDFTRVIIEFEQRPTWTLRRKGVGYRLQFSHVTPLHFDLSRVFRSIDRSRVADIRAVGNNTLDIDLACPCSVAPQDAGDSALVIDVRQILAGGPDVQVSPPALLPPVNTDRMPNLPRSAHGRAAVRTVPAPLFDVLPDERERSLTLPVWVQDAAGNIGPTHDGAAVALMASALARAATQGLVDADPAAIARQRERLLGQLPATPGQSNVTVSTVFDAVIPSDLRDVPPSENGQVCVKNQRVDVASWGNAEDTAMLGRLRSQAIAEDGSVTSDGAQALARYYVFLGFGMEARQIARFIDPSDDRDIITALADIMDFGATGSTVFRDQVGCEGAVSLWAVLARPGASDTMPISKDDVLSTFSALPAHLRTHLGPLLSERLHQVGLQESARTAMNAVTRGGNRTEESRLAQARLELSGTHADDARDTLSELSKSTSVTAAGALLELLQDAESRGMAPNPSWVEDAPTLVGALEGTEIAEQLNIAGLRGLVALGRYKEFRAEIGRDAPGLTPDSRTSLAVYALKSALVDGSDAQFLNTEVALSYLAPSGVLDRATRYGFAERLMSLGLPSRAKTYLVAERPNTLPELRLTVDIMRLDGRAEQAIDLARQSHVMGAEAVVADLLVAVGDSLGAIGAYETAGDVAQARAAAIRTGTWSWVAAHGEGNVAEAAKQLIMTETEVAPETQTELRAASKPSNAALIEETRARRAKMRDLLSFTGTGASEESFTN